MTHSHGYRPDIDGLRAIAVTAVLLHHLSASILPGGYVGVDVFFVISGYLITGQIYKEAHAGTFSLKEFYKRRINRIVPALVAVVVVVLLAGVLLVSPADIVKLSKSAVTSLLGLSNFFFWKEYGNYFAGNASEAPLLHTWSLGVEEQFYVAWPLMVLFLAKMRRHHMAIVLSVLAIAAVAVSQFAIGIVASASYYLLPARFFEFLIGGMLAFWVMQRQSGQIKHVGACLVAGYALVFGSMFFLSPASPFPGVNALWPCLGAALLIWAGGEKHFLSDFLKSRAAVFLGLISYSVYLWHWPIIAYLNYMKIPLDVFSGGLVVIASVLLGWLTWRTVEVPLRRSGAGFSFGSVFAKRFAMPLTVVLVVAVATNYTKGFPDRFDARVAEFERALEVKPDVLRQGCHVPTALYASLPDENACRLGANKSELDAMLIGDSFANHFTGMFDVMGKAHNVALMDYTMDGCPPILGYRSGPSETYIERCQKRNQQAYAKISEKKFDKIFLASNWPKDDEAGRLLEESVRKILQSGAKLSLVINNMSIPDANSCPVRNLMHGTGKDCNVQRQPAVDYLLRIKAHYPQVAFIDPNQVICQGGSCRPVFGNTLLYRDSGHLNDVGSRLIGQQLLNSGVGL